MDNGYILGFKYCALNNTADATLCQPDDWTVMLVNAQNEVLWNSQSGSFSTWNDDPYGGEVHGQFVANDELYGLFSVSGMSVSVQ